MLLLSGRRLPDSRGTRATVEAVGSASDPAERNSKTKSVLGQVLGLVRSVDDHAQGAFVLFLWLPCLVLGTKPDQSVTLLLQSITMQAGSIDHIEIIQDYTFCIPRSSVRSVCALRRHFAFARFLEFLVAIFSRLCMYSMTTARYSADSRATINQCMNYRDEIK